MQMRTLAQHTQNHLSDGKKALLPHLSPSRGLELGQVHIS
jgi:hypothetical protein